MARKNRRHNKENNLIGAFLFIGIGIGLITGQVAAGVLIGFGVGIILAYLSSEKSRRKIN